MQRARRVLARGPREPEAKIVSAINALGADVVALRRSKSCRRGRWYGPRRVLARLVEASTRRREPTSAPLRPRPFPAEDVIRCVYLRLAIAAPVGEPGIDDDPRLRAWRASPLRSSDSVTAERYAPHPSWSSPTTSSRRDPSRRAPAGNMGQRRRAGQRERDTRRPGRGASVLRRSLLDGADLLVDTSTPTPGGSRALEAAGWAHKNRRGEIPVVYSGRSGSLDHVLRRGLPRAALAG